MLSTKMTVLSTVYTACQVIYKKKNRQIKEQKRRKELY